MANEYDYGGFQKPYTIIQRGKKSESTDAIWKKNKVWYKEDDKVFVMNKKGESKIYTK